MTNRLSRIGEFFKSRFSMVDGPDFYGQILDLPDTSRVSNFLSVRRYLRTSVNTNVQARNVIIAGSVKYIVACHGDGYYKESIYKHFKLFEVDEIWDWYPVKEHVDPVTKVRNQTRDDYEGLVHLSTQPMRFSDDPAINIPLETKIAVVDKAVNVDDKIGNYIVTKTDVVLGVNLIELKKL